MKHIKQRSLLIQQKSGQHCIVLKSYKSCSSLDLSVDTQIFILGVFLARCNSLFLHSFSLSVFFLPFFNMGNGGAFFCCCLSAILYSLSLNRHCACIVRGRGTAEYTVRRGRELQQHMDEYDCNFSDTPLGSDWLC